MPKFKVLFAGLLAVLFLLSRLAPVFAQQVTDEQLRERVKISIERGQQFLISQQNANGEFPHGHQLQEVGGNSLIGLALIYSGVPTSDPAIQSLLRYIRKQPDPGMTYSRGLGIMFLAAAGEAKTRDRAKIAAWTQALVNSQTASGDWGYSRAEEDGDNSNTQYAILGLRDAAFHAGVEIEPQVWQKIQQHWLQKQVGPVQGASGWSYGRDNGFASATGSMTVAGLASLEIASSFLVEDKLLPDGKLDCCGNAEKALADQALDAGARWMDNNIQVGSNPGMGDSHLFYYLYGLERAGKFGGRRFYGDTDWYREGAKMLTAPHVQSQVNFSWEGGNLISTSMALLFLSKGLSPVLVNKLEYGTRSPNGRVASDHWNRHRRDISNLVDYISLQDQWPHYLSWQTLDMQVAVKREGVAALQQAPVAYLSGDQNLDTITDAEVELLRDYITQGGFLFAVQNCDSPQFDQGFRTLITRLFPNGDYQLRKLESTHDIYRSETVFSSDPPELWGVDFGCRTAIVYAPFDHACRWGKWIPHDRRENAQLKFQIVKSLQLGTNVIAYATGRELRDKLQRPDTLAELDRDSSGLTIGRLKHSGGWDTAANAVKHLQMALSKVNIATNPESPVIAANDPALFDCPVLYMHGGKNFTISPEEVTQLKAYFENGGFLMADACCGSKKFDDSFRKLIQQVFDKELTPIPVKHELFHLTSGYELGKVRCRIPDPAKSSALRAQESVREPAFEGIEVNGRYVVVYSRYDISCALERQQTVACAGYLDEDAVKLAINIVLYALYQ